MHVLIWPPLSPLLAIPFLPICLCIFDAAIAIFQPTQTFMGVFFFLGGGGGPTGYLGPSYWPRHVDDAVLSKVKHLA